MLNWTRKKDKIWGETNSSFLALIPKEKNPTSLDRFRPIPLCNTSYKILSKILAMRIKSIMGHLISNLQGGFVHGCQILNNIIIIQGDIHSIMERKQQRMAIKLNMANAFDRVNHFFCLKSCPNLVFTKYL